jgi:hypothetical protein
MTKIVELILDDMTADKLAAAAAARTCSPADLVADLLADLELDKLVQDSWTEEDERRLAAIDAGEPTIANAQVMGFLQSVIERA